jgi:hypothetical protein
LRGLPGAARAKHVHREERELLDKLSDALGMAARHGRSGRKHRRFRARARCVASVVAPLTGAAWPLGDFHDVSA